MSREFTNKNDFANFALLQIQLIFAFLTDSELSIPSEYFSYKLAKMNKTCRKLKLFGLNAVPST